MKANVYEQIEVRKFHSRLEITKANGFPKQEVISVFRRCWLTSENVSTTDDNSCNASFV